MPPPFSGWMKAAVAPQTTWRRIPEDIDPESYGMCHPTELKKQSIDFCETWYERHLDSETGPHVDLPT